MDTPQWNNWCVIFNKLSHAREELIKHQNDVMKLVQDDMNKPGKDNTEKILEKNIDLELLKEILKPLINAVGKLN